MGWFGRLVRLAPVALVTLVGDARPSAAFVALEGQFLATAACPAFQSFRQESNPGGVVTRAGERYPVVGRNAERGDWIQIRIEGTDPPLRWVELRCGALDDGRTTAPQRAELQRRELPPFFDDVDDGLGDPTPPAPVLGAFDRAVLEVCGPWGSRPRAAAFRAMLDRPEVAVEVDEIHELLGGGIVGRAVPLPRFKDELTRAWFAEDGFVHVFCGEPSGNTIGGLHFAGRYLQLQEQDLAGLMASRECRAEIEPPIYTIGVRFRQPGTGRLRTACPKGYALGLDAVDLLVEATEPLKAAGGGRSKAMCLAPVGGRRDDPDYLAVFVGRDRAVVTFYPDASPACDGARPAWTCLCAE